MGGAKVAKCRERGPVIPARWMLCMAVKVSIVGYSDRLQTEAVIIFNADDRWPKVDQRFQKPVIVAVDIDRQHSDVGKGVADDVEVIERQKAMFYLRMIEKRLASGLGDHCGVAVDDKTAPRRIGR